jgi:hypothetical protein
MMPDSRLARSVMVFVAVLIVISFVLGAVRWGI